MKRSMENTTTPVVITTFLDESRSLEQLDEDYYKELEYSMEFLREEAENASNIADLE